MDYEWNKSDWKCVVITLALGACVILFAFYKTHREINHVIAKPETKVTK